MSADPVITTNCIGPFVVDEVCRHDDGTCTVTLTADLETVRKAGAHLLEEVYIAPKAKP